MVSQTRTRPRSQSVGKSGAGAAAPSSSSSSSAAPVRLPSPPARSPTAESQTFRESPSIESGEPPERSTRKRARARAKAGEDTQQPKDPERADEQELEIEKENEEGLTLKRRSSSRLKKPGSPAAGRVSSPVPAGALMGLSLQPADTWKTGPAHFGRTQSQHDRIEDTQPVAEPDATLSKPKPGRSSSRSASVLAAGWACSACTLMNKSFRIVCDACGEVGAHWRLSMIVVFSPEPSRRRSCRARKMKMKSRRTSYSHPQNLNLNLKLPW